MSQESPARLVPSVGAVAALVFLLQPVSARAQRPDAAQRSGEIRGVFDYCGAAGNAGIVVHIPGRSFSAKLDPSGQFVLNYVPPGTYTVVAEIPQAPPHTIPGVVSADNTVTNLGTIVVCPDTDGDGATQATDCNDNNATIFPGAPELCDGVDNDCDLVVDEGCAACTDADMDGFFAQAGCGTLVDCNDSNPTIRPSAQELCDGVDNDCDGQVNEGFDLDADNNNCGMCGLACGPGSLCVSGVCSCTDFDGDGYFSGPGCGTPVDCNDGDPAQNPGAMEICNNVDENCDGTVDEGLGLLTCGTGACQVIVQACVGGLPGICTPAPPSPEVCDMVDNDCDGLVDEDVCP